MISEYEFYWYWLASTQGVGAKRILSLAEQELNFAELFALAKQGKPLEQFGLAPAIAKRLAARANRELLEEELLELKRKKIGICTMVSHDYPPLLKEIHAPPALLYYKGSMDVLKEKALAVVGSREASRAGTANIRHISRELAEAGVCIISGMARGIDVAAHRGALDAECGRTIAVLGCGVDIAYPRENQDIYEQICERGAVISEYRPGTTPLPGNFPVRNRIMSGMVPGVLVGDGKAKSGAQITVRLAVEEGRDVFALPTEAMNPLFELPNLLLAEGAHVCLSSESILNFYGWGARERKESRLAQPQGLDFLEGELYNLLLKGEMEIQELADSLGKQPQELSVALTKLELKGLIVRLAGNVFALSREDGAGMPL